MKLTLLFLLSLLIGASNCNTKNNSSSLPDCIHLKIKVLQAAPVQNPPAVVSSYVYNGSTVYYFTAPCCDQYNPVYDANCKLICHPNGGITGKGDGKCADFSDVATNREVLWKDTRSNKETF